MIVRESPKARGSRPALNWPPKSPHEALLSSPSGRKRLEARHRDVSPSPVKRSVAKLRDNASHSLRSDSAEDDEEEEEEEDEETLQLKLQAIEAKLKLKRLQRAKEKGADGSARGENVSLKSPTKNKAPERSRSSAADTSRASRRTPEFQVPVSPVRRRTPPLQTSPARVILGIDKGLRAQDVSLKRSPHRARLTGSINGLSAKNNGQPSSTSSLQAKSFNERLADSRAQEKQKQERDARNLKSRSSGFGLKTHEGSETRQINLPLSPRKATSALAKTKSFQDLAAQRSISSSTSTPMIGTSSSHRTSSPDKMTDMDEAAFDSYSGLHLSKRQLSHTILTRTLADKEIFPLPRLLKTVHSPAYEPPDIEGDYVVVGIIAGKSLPRDHKETHKTTGTGDPDNRPQRTKFMVIRLTDLKWELDLFLFGSGFEAFWKLTPGTVIAILNPGIMPPRNNDSGAFSLKLTSSEDTVLEIGTARDLGFCEATKKDGKKCGQWIDARKTQFCEFHLALQLEKTKAGRMEVNTMSGFNRTKESKWTFMGGGAGKKKGVQSRDVISQERLGPSGRQYDAGLHTEFYVTSRAGRTAALFDNDADHNAFDRGMNRDELHRKRLAEREKEKELGSQLAMMGSSAGSEYLRMRHPEMTNSNGSRLLDSSTSESLDARNAISLGLLNKKASDVSLAAANKRKRPTTSSSAGSQPMGWSGAYKRGLPEKLKNGETNRPQQKKTRLFLDGKGIRTPGRESLPNLNPAADDDDDDDDDLDIIL